MGVARTRTTAQATAEGLRVFVAGVPWHITEEILRRDFEECGVVEDLFLLRDQDGNSRGRSFITFRDADAVQAALKFDNTEYGGRTIYVKIAEEKRGASSGGQDAPVEKPANCISLCLKNIGDASEADVRKFLDGRAIQAVRVLSDRATGAPRGIAFVDFESTEDVDEAMKLNSKKVKGLSVQMNYVDQKPAVQAPKRDKSSKFPEEKPEGCTSLCFKNLGDATEDDIWEFLNGLAVQAVRVCYDRVSGAPRGIAFVDFSDTQDVDKAMQRNGKELKGIVVQMYYEAPKERPYPEGCMTVAIKKLPPNALEHDVRKLFKGLKSIVDVRVICDKNDTCTGLAFAEFSNVADVQAAVRRDGMSVHGQVIFICYETKQKKARDWQAGEEATAEEMPKSRKRKAKDAIEGECASKALHEEVCESKKAKRGAKRKENASQPVSPEVERHEVDEGTATSEKEPKQLRRKLKKAEKRISKSVDAGDLDVKRHDAAEGDNLDASGSVKKSLKSKKKKKKLVETAE